MNSKLGKILELCEFSAGVCGVWQRVKQESEELARKGYEVRIFSSNAVKDSNKTAKSYEKLGKLVIRRFPFKKLGGESFLSWFNKKVMKEAIKFNPNIIIAHVYRHLHTAKALQLAKKLKKQRKCKVFLVTHAPFIEKNQTRTFLESLIVNFYDRFISHPILNKFDKIITITKWENQYLLKLGCKKEKLVYIPNGIPDEFFKAKKTKFRGKNIIFLGRISPIKNLEVLFKTIKILKDKKINIKLKIIGPVEKKYGLKLAKLANSLNLNSKSKIIEFYPPIYDLDKKIKKLNEADIFVLPSKREAMPQALIEAMALGKIVICSKTQGGREIIKDKRNGFLFSSDDEKELADIISFCIKKQNKKKIDKIRNQARKTAENFSWKNLIKKLEKLFNN